MCFIIAAKADRLKPVV